MSLPFLLGFYYIRVAVFSRLHKNTNTKTNKQNTTTYKQQTNACKNSSVVSALWYGPKNTMLRRDGPGYDVVLELGPTSHTTSLWARLLHNVIMGPAIEVRGQGGTFDICLDCFGFNIVVVFMLLLHVSLFLSCLCNPKEPQTNKNLQEPTQPAKPANIETKNKQKHNNSAIPWLCRRQPGLHSVITGEWPSRPAGWGTKSPP